MSSILDSEERLKAIDTKAMLSDLAKYPEDAIHAIALAEKLHLSDLQKSKYNSIIFLGMGGSAIGGQLIGDWLFEESSIPILVNRGYNLPKHINEKTLVFAVSYSGNTEETLSAFNKACDMGCSIIAITSGGKLEQEALQRKVPYVKMPGSRQPRSALVYQFFIPATLLKRLGLTGDAWNQVDETIELLSKLRDTYNAQNPTNLNRSKQLSIEMKDTIPFIYGPRFCQGVTYRLNTQFNENSKTPTSHGVFPEVFHNAIMGTEGSKHVLEPLSYIIIRDPVGEKVLAHKIDRFIDIIRPRVNKLIQVQASGDGLLARMFSIIYLGDFTSAYLGILQGYDPNTTHSIDKLKRSP